MSDSALLAAALRYAARGWAVFPCSPANKQPLVKGDVDPATGKAIPRTGGVKKASTDAAQIRAWWGKWPDAMIGVAMGGGSGLIAIDFDPRVDAATGEEFPLERLKAELEAQIGEALPLTATAITQSGGVHLYFAMPAGEAIGNRGNLPLHVDVRGDGGYVIMPPSRMASGAMYRWRRTPDSVAIAPLPASLEAVLRTPGKAKAKAADEGTAEAEPSTERQATSSPTPRVADSDVVADGRRRFGLALLSKTIDELARAREGNRGAQLNKAAFTLGGAVAAGILSRAVVVSELKAACDRNGLTGKDGAASIDYHVEHSLSAGEGDPIDLASVDEDTRQRAGWRRRRATAGSNAAAPAAAAAGGGPPDPPDAPALPGPAPGGGDVEESSHMGGSGDERPPEQVAADRECWHLPMTAFGNAERWAIRYGRDFLHCPEVGWLAWDGRRWSREDADARFGASVFETIRAIQHEARYVAASGCPDGDITLIGVEPEPTGHDVIIKIGGTKRNPVFTLLSDKLRAWGRASETGGMIREVAGRGEVTNHRPMTAFDANPWLLNVANGTLEIARGGPDFPSTVTLRPPRREDLITMLAPVFHDPAATCPTYDAFLARVQPKAGVRDFLHAWAGYSMTGNTGEQKFVINHGAKGANGKSTWIDLLAAMLGDYAIAVNIAVFMDEKIRSGSSPSPDLAELPRKRLVRTSEPPKGAPFAEALVKLVTGGEPLPARQLNKPFFRFVPEFKITVSMNPVPELSSDPAIWRRTLIVPWDVSIPPDERDPDLPAKLREEMSGVLNHCLKGLLSWCDFGLQAPDEVRSKTAEVQDSRSPLERFLRTACDRSDPVARVGATALYKVFEAWCLWAGEAHWTQKGFAAALADAGIAKKQSDTIFYLGLRLVKSREDFCHIIRRDDGSEKLVPRTGDDSPAGGLGGRRDGDIPDYARFERDEWEGHPPDRED